jgi:hypothetical protein
MTTMDQKLYSLRAHYPRLGMGLIAVLLVMSMPARSAPSLVKIQPISVHQGQVMMVTVPDDPPLSQTTIRFAGRVWPLYRVGSSWETFLGTDPTTKAGRYVVSFDALTPDGTPLGTRLTVTVVNVPFPTRRLTFDAQTQKLMTPAAAEQEWRRTEAALRVLHAGQLWEGAFQLPVSGPVTSPYGVLSIYQGQVWGFHRGVDLGAPMGTPIQAANDGIVRLAEGLPLSGNAVLIDHGLGVVSSYFHMSAIHVATGESVRKGQIIGAVGMTGLSLGPHLHWGVRVNGVHVDPLPWLSSLVPRQP